MNRRISHLTAAEYMEGNKMKAVSWIKETKREYIREKKRALRAIKKEYKVLRGGSALHQIYGTEKYHPAVRDLGTVINEIDEILKNIKC